MKYTLAIYHELFTYDITNAQEREKARLREGIGRRKDDSCNITLAIYHELSIYDMTTMQEKEKARLREEILQKARPSTWAFSYSWESRHAEHTHHRMTLPKKPSMLKRKSVACSEFRDTTQKSDKYELIRLL